MFQIDSGKDTLGPTFLAKISQQQETPGQTLLAGVEKPIDEILPNAFEAFPSLFSTLFLTCSFKDFNLSRRGVGTLLVCLAVPRGLDLPSASRAFEADADAFRSPKLGLTTW